MTTILAKDPTTMPVPQHQTARGEIPFPASIHLVVAKPPLDIC